MVLTSSEFQALVSAFEFLLKQFPLSPETDLLIERTEDFLEKLNSQPGYKPNSKEIDNCIIALQNFCSKNPSASSEHLSLLQRFLSLQFRSF